MRRLRAGLASLAVLAALGEASGAPRGEPALTPTSLPVGTVKATAERSIEAPASGARASRRDRRPSGAGTRPLSRGPRVPAELRATLEKQLEARVERDIARIAALRSEAIALLTTFVTESPRGAREMPEALLRLGELEWEVEREGFVARFAAWEKLPVDQRGPAPAPRYEGARARFQRVLTDYPRFGDTDLALYIDGFLATEQGKGSEALDRFTRILKDHPRSRFVPDAHMALAESYFNDRYDYAAALAEYERVLAYKESELYGLALFKSAWCLWRLGRSEEAAKRFVSVFEVADARAGKASAQQRRALDELQSEALKYLVEVFTEDEKNSASDVYNFLVKIGGDRFAARVVRALGDQFYDQAHYERGIEAYELLLKLEPTSPDAGRTVLRIAEGYSVMEDYGRLAKAYERAAAQYTAGSAWAKNQADKKNVDATTREIEKQLREDALRLHEKAQRDRTSLAEFEGAAALYGVYLGRFGKEREAYRVHYYLAEIHFHHTGKSTEAADHYMAAARAIPAAEAEREPLRTLRHDALFNAIAALERTREREVEAQRKSGGPRRETEADKKFAEVLDLYAQLYPRDPALPELFYRQGKSYYDAGVYDPSVKILGSLLERFPESPYAVGAGELILDSFHRSKNYENVELWSRRLKQAPAFRSADNQRKLDALIVQAVFKQGEQRAQAGDHAGASKAYLRAAKEFPRDPRAAQACVNAELAAQKAGDLATLKEAALLVTGKDYRDKPEAPQGAWIAATTLQAMGLFADAASMHETISESAEKGSPAFTRFEHTKDAAFNAVLLRATMGDHDRAIASGKRYLERYPTSAESDEVAFQMGRAHQAAGRHKDAIELYRRYLPRTKNADHKVQGLVLIALAQTKLGDDAGAARSLKEAVALGKRRRSTLGPEGKYAAARARYLEGEQELARFQKIRIEGDVKQLSQRLKQKAELLKNASKVFLDVVGMGVAEWTTAALYQIGFTYESFAKALRDAPPPDGLSAEDTEAYQAQIDSFVVPIEERALDAYENGWRKAVELSIYNSWTGKMREALGRLNGELFPPMREVGIDVQSQGTRAMPPLLDAPRSPTRAPAAKPEGAR